MTTDQARQRIEIEEDLRVTREFEQRLPRLVERDPARRIAFAHITRGVPALKKLVEQDLAALPAPVAATAGATEDVESRGCMLS